MPKKSVQKPALPSSIPPMGDLPLAEQDEVIDRHQTRHDIREAMKELAAALKEWVDDLVMDPERFEHFNAGGHKGEYRGEYPEKTLARKLADLGWTPEQIDSMRESGTPLDLMNAEELGYVLDRIQKMLAWFAHNTKGGPYRRACEIYEAVGELVREAVLEQTGHAPEQFPTPRVKITGRESAKRVKPQPYRVPLLPTPEEETE